MKKSSDTDAISAVELQAYYPLWSILHTTQFNDAHT